MQEREESPILINFRKAIFLMLTAAQHYLRTGYKCAGGDRYGQYHGKSGINRANHLTACLQVIKHDNKLAILTILLAIFGKPPKGLFDIHIGRSSALASMIADNFIRGESEYGFTADQENTLTSEVFSASSLEKVKRDRNAIRSVPNEIASFSYLDKTIAVRFLLQDMLNSAEFVNHKTVIESLAKKLEGALTSSAPQVNLKIFDALKDQFSIYKESVTTACLNDKKPSLPAEIDAHISTFFTLKDAGNIARTNKLAGAAARSNGPTRSRIVR